MLNSKNELLMIHHNKLNRWCPPGGKVDNEETPDQAAIRECFEETGVNIELIGEKPNFDGALVTPLGSQCNIIKPNEREHVDLLYVARAKNEDLYFSGREAKNIGWFNLEQVEKSGTFDNVIYWYKKILEKI